MAEGFKSSLRPPLLDLTVDSYATFKSWKTKLQDYVLLSGLKDKDEEFQAAMMRYTFLEKQETFTILWICQKPTLF